MDNSVDKFIVGHVALLSLVPHNGCMEKTLADCEAEAMIDERIQKEQTELANLTDELNRLAQELAFRMAMLTIMLSQRQRDITLAKLGI